MAFLRHRRPFFSYAATFRYTKSLLRYATTYTGEVVEESSTSGGRHSISIQVRIDPPPVQILHDSRGYPILRRNLICRLLHLISSSSFSAASDYLDALNLIPTAAEVSEILKSLRSSPKKSLQFFKYAAEEIPGFRHDCFTYTRMIWILGMDDDIDGVIKLLEEMEKERIQGTVSTVNILIGVSKSKDDLERYVGLSEKWGLRMNCYSYKCLVQAWMRLRDVERAFRVYEQMKRCGFVLDVFGCNMLIDALAKNGQVENAYGVFGDMKCKYVEPDEYTYTILIRMAGKHGRRHEFLTLIDELISKGRALNLMTYNTILEAFATNQMMDKAIFLFSKMVEECRPNEFTYSVILDALLADGQLNRLDEVVAMSEKYMNKSIYSFLVSKLSRLGHASEAHKLFCLMWSCDYKGGSAAYLSMIENLCNAGKTEEAIDLLKKIKEHGLDVDTVMYNIIFSALGRSKKISSILELYDQMKEDGLTPTVCTYNILISSFGKSRRVKEACQLFEEMENSECKPDVVTYNALINCLGKNGELDEAHMRFKEMQERGLCPDVITYSTLIECFGKTSSIDMACRLFDEMIAEGCSPNIVTYNILLDCLVRSKRTTEADSLYERLKKQGLTPDNITYSVLERMQSCSSRSLRVRKQSKISGWVVSPLR